MEQNEIYSGKALLKRTPQSTAVALCIVAIFCAAVFYISVFLPASWIFELGAIIIAAIRVNKILKEGTFTLTYILYDDRIVLRRRYGFIEIDTDVFLLKDCIFTENKITCNGKTIDFFPDNQLKMLLNL